MLTLLALTACQSIEDRVDEAVDIDVQAPPVEGHLNIATAPDRAERTRAPVIEAPLPEGAPILHDCFGLGSDGSNRGGTFGGNGSAAAPVGGVIAKPQAKRRRTVSKGDAAAPAPPPMVAAAPAREQRQAGPQAFQAKDGAQEPERPMNNVAAETAATVEKAPLADADEEDRADSVASDDRPGEAAMDWGATVFLSNDDSMSLASAQRVLYSLSRGVGLSPTEIRPHELLNYFSFDTAGPPTDQAVSVLGAAEQDGDTLTVSLAVHGANPPRQPLDMTVLLDRSCSMQGEGRMDYTKRGLGLLSDQLQKGDRVDVVLFDSSVCTPLEGFVVGRDDPALLSNVIANLRPTGSTNLSAGLDEAYRIQQSRDAAEVHRRNRRVLLITDANLNTGNVDQNVVSQVGSMYEDHGIRMTGIGVGRDFNDKMLDMLTEKGKGAYVYLGSEAVVDRIFGPSFDSLTRTIAHDVRFSLDLPDSLAMEKFYGEEASTNAEDVQPIHYYADTSQLFLQDLRIRDGRLVRTDPVVMTIDYRDAVTGEPETQQLRTTVGALLDGDPHNLRKGKALMAFSDVVMAKAMGANPCGEALQAYRSSTNDLANDAEIGFVNGLVGNLCGVDLTTVVAKGVAFKVRVDADLAIPEVELECSGRSHLEKLSGSDTVAKFSAVTPGACTIKLQGTMPMAAAVEVPKTGGDIRCLVRGGRLSCG